MTKCVDLLQHRAFYKMALVAEHYLSHLGPVYVWMAGGLDAALERGAQEIETLSLFPVHNGHAVDLGAGFGMHAIPLARRGFSVLAIDSCTELLETLQESSGELAITAVNDELRNFGAHLQGKAELVLCMGDTITHLPTFAAVEELIHRVASKLCSGGQFVLTFRDYGTPLEAERRFILVRSDQSRIATCFLEYGHESVAVHDILHENKGSEWKLRVSSYQKLRLTPAWMENALRSAGFEFRTEAGFAGMVRMIARHA